MRLEQLRGGWSLVTGAASGIGRASALALAARGSNLVLCDLDAAGLTETEERARSLGRRVLARRVDVADRDAMTRFADEVHGEIEALDLLMNNAGVALGAYFVDTTLEDWDWILAINVRGVVHGCHLFVPPMVRRGHGGHVVNVSSMAGFLGGPTFSAYCTTKFAVRGLSEALREELRPHRIGVTTLCPGVINTAIIRNARRRGVVDSEDSRREGQRVFEKLDRPPEQVARRMLRAVARDRGLVTVTPEARLFYFMKRLSPGLARVAARALEPAGMRRARQVEGGTG